MGRKLALVIGNSEYDDASLARLITPSEDVSDLAVLPGQGGMTAIDRSDGADLNADQVTVGGDVTGRDKIIQIKAEAGATVIVGQTGVTVQPSSSSLDEQPSPPAT